MSWNLVWTSKDSENKVSSISEFVVLFGDEPILTKTMYGQITKSDNIPHLTFVESSYKFSFEDFNEFTSDFELGKQAKFSFDVLDGEDAFAYDETKETLIIALSSYTSNLKFEIPIDGRTRSQFVAEFRKFLKHSLECYEKFTKTESVDDNVTL